LQSSGLLQSSGIVHAADGVSLIIANHALILHVVAGRGKWIPPLGEKLCDRLGFD